MKQILQRNFPEIIKIRHYLHENPELANDEVHTAALVADTLKKFGYQVITGIAGTGISAVLDSGKPGKTVALRADMDALPIQEQTNLPYKSKNDGKMHACGHDGHTATLLAVAGALTECTHQFKGKIKFIFQPAEEIGAGAIAMIKSGILENPKVDAIFGYHNSPKQKAGFVVAKSGCIMAGQDVFTITIKGQGGHAAHPDATIDPIYVGSAVIQAIQSIVSRFTSPTEPVVISVTQFHAGNVNNVIPDEAVVNGSIRTVSIDAQKNVKQQLTDIATGIASSFGATATVKFLHSFPPTINHQNETELLLNSAERILGKEKVVRINHSSMASEDFSYYLEKVPGCFFFVGNGLDQYTIHSPRYEFNDEIIPIAAQVMGQVAIDYLNAS